VVFAISGVQSLVLLIKNILIVSVFFLTACASTGPRLSDIENDVRVNESIPIVNKGATPEFAFYFDDQDRVDHLCFGDSCVTKANEDHFSIDVTKNGFVSPVSYKGRVVCGVGSLHGFLGVVASERDDTGMSPGFSFDNHSQLNADVCQSPKRFLDNRGFWIFSHNYMDWSDYGIVSVPGALILSFLTGGTNLLSSLGLYNTQYSQEQFDSYVRINGANSIISKIFYSNRPFANDGYVPIVHIERDDIEDSIDDAFSSLANKLEKQRYSKPIVGVVFVEKETKEYLSYIPLRPFRKSAKLDQSISMQAQMLIDDVLNPDNLMLQKEHLNAYIPKKVLKPRLPRKPDCKKGEYETKADFEDRCVEIVDDYLDTVRNLQLSYSENIKQRNEIIADLSEKYEEKIAGNVEFAQEINEEIPELLRLLYLANTEYRIKDLRFDAEEEYLYFTVYTPFWDFKKEARAEMDAIYAKRIKEDNNYKVLAEIELDDGLVSLGDIELVELKSDRNFDVEFTDLNYKPETVLANVSVGNIDIKSKAQDTFAPLVQNYEMLADLSSASISVDVKNRVNARPPEWFSECFSDRDTVHICERGANKANALDKALGTIAKRKGVSVESTTKSKMRKRNLTVDQEFSEESTVKSKYNFKDGDYSEAANDPLDGYWYISVACNICEK